MARGWLIFRLNISTKQGLGIRMITDRIKREIRHGAVAFLVLYPLLMSYIYFSTVNSSEYVTAVKYLKENQIVENEVGYIEDISLSPFSGLKISITGDSGQAKFVLKVRGTKAKAKYQIYLLRKSGIWQVSEANLLN